MHGQWKFTIGFLDVSDWSIVTNSQNRKWVKAGDIFKWHHGRIVKEPYVPEEATHKASVHKFFLKDGRTSLFRLHCSKRSALRTCTRGWECFKGHVAPNQRLQDPKTHWQDQEGQKWKGKEVEGRIVILKLVVFVLLVAFKVVLKRWHRNLF